MEISEIALYVGMGFVPTFLALEASWRLALRKRAGITGKDGTLKVPQN